MDYLSLIFSGVVTISTVTYAFLTWKLVSETRKMRKSQIEPIITAYLMGSEADASYAYLKIKNVGLGLAKNVSFKIIKDVKDYDNNSMALDELGVFKNGIRAFNPSDEKEFFMTFLGNDYEKKIKEYYKFEVTYYDVIGNKYSEEIQVDFEELARSSRVTTSTYIGTIANELNKLNNSEKTTLSKILKELKKD